MSRVPVLLLTALAILFTCACADRPLEVASIQIGRSVNQDSSIAAATSVFKPTDTIYVSVHTTDLGSGTITVRWSYEGRLLTETSKAVSYRIASDTEFHMQHPSEFPQGPYTVDVLLNGKPVASRSFTVVAAR
jgi:hypothetical protein